MDAFCHASVIRIPSGPNMFRCRKTACDLGLSGIFCHIPCTCLNINDDFKVCICPPMLEHHSVYTSWSVNHFVGLSVLHKSYQPGASQIVELMPLGEDEDSDVIFVLGDQVFFFCMGSMQHCILCVFALCWQGHGSHHQQPTYHRFLLQAVRSITLMLRLIAHT